MTISIRFLCFIFKHTHNGFIKRRCIKKICQLEGGESYSQTVRMLFEKYYGLHIGYGTYGSVWTNGSLRWQDIYIGNYCSFASNTAIYTGNHPMDNFTTHPILYNPSFGATHVVETGTPITIGNDVWVGQNVVILPGCKSIGNGAVIGAGAVVTKDIEPYTMSETPLNPSKNVSLKSPYRNWRQHVGGTWKRMSFSETKTICNVLSKKTKHENILCHRTSV